MSTFILIRHGKKVETIGDPPLSEVGVRQAQATSEILQKITINAVYTSPLLRTSQTAEYIALPHNLTIKKDTRLRERSNWGDLPDQTFEQFLVIWEYCNNNRDYDPPVGDSARKAGERLEQFLREKHSIYPIGTIIVVAHGGVIADFLINNFPLNYLEEIRPLFIQKKSGIIKECSISTLQFDGNHFSIDSLANIDHLAGIA